MDKVQQQTFSADKWRSVGRMPHAAGQMLYALGRRLWPAILAHWPLLSILLIALTLRLALWSQPAHQPANDEVEYIAVAQDLLAGRGWQFYDAYHWLRAPLYPLFLAGSLWLAGGNLELAALPNIALSVANVYLVYLLTAEVVRQWLGPQRPSPIPLIAALIAALLFTLNTFASLYMSETLFTFLFTAALLLLARWRRHIDDDQHPSPVSYLPSSISRFLPHAAHLLASAGIFFGLAALTRSLPMAFMPIVLLWIVVSSMGNGRQTIDHRPLVPSLIRRCISVVPALLFGVCIALPIAPWTLRNCLAYESCILIETGLSYNMWAFNEPREDMQTIFRTLEQIPDPAARAAEATQRGVERLREDPAILLRKLPQNWFHLWRVKIIQDRFLLADYSSDPPPVIFLSSLLLDDALYFVVLMTSVVGISRATWTDRRITPLLAAWVVYVVGITLLTHGESRYRHFLFPILIPYAAVQIASFAVRLPARATRTSHPPSPIAHPLSPISHLPAFLLIGLLLYTVAISYPWQWAWDGATRSVHRWHGNIALAMDNPAAAAAAYERALDADITPDGWIALGDVRRQQGDLAGAESAYRNAWRRELDHIAASARLGDLLRAQDRTTEARDAFVGRYVDEQDVLDWSWHNLEPPSTHRLDVGDGLDFGYVDGMYPTEQQQGAAARWTNGHARLRLAADATASAPLLKMRLAAPHPNGERITAQVCVADHCQTVVLDSTWRTFTLKLPVAAAQPQIVEIHSPTFVSPDGRHLGVLVDWVQT